MNAPMPGSPDHVAPGIEPAVSPRCRPGPRPVDVPELDDEQWRNWRSRVVIVRARAELIRRTAILEAVVGATCGGGR